MRREEFSPKVKVQAFERARGFCEHCRAYLYPGKFHFDHVRASALLGEPTLKNCAVLCIACHSAKTLGEDMSRIVKAKRQERKHIGARKPATMPGSRNSKWKKRLDGRVEKR